MRENGGGAGVESEATNGGAKMAGVPGSGVKRPTAARKEQKIYPRHKSLCHNISPLIETAQAVDEWRAVEGKSYQAGR
ncbi:hypothetical protein [Maritalea porphyrae]|uniref:hypothetical protein n=1 Tax=Maritalea porphyrae TaxID=880732 RepID=UPI0022AE7767|nr:hypothetical protein [Maritalea porphyrae]MCZ4272668.1 hypothetical protein [Maritalea porphyrae]